jgi:uncharacterized coiled-coil protein SlyX
MLRKDNQNMRARLSRIDHRLAHIENTLSASQQADIDQAEADTNMQEQIDALIERIEKLEHPDR